jgi:hypothetical protein
MQTARYHRDQAELCLQMARSMSDPQAANVLRASRPGISSKPLRWRRATLSATRQGHQVMTAEDFSDSFYYRAIRTKIGEALRSGLEPTEPPPKRLLDLLQALDRPRVDPSPPRGIGNRFWGVARVGPHQHAQGFSRPDQSSRGIHASPRSEMPLLRSGLLFGGFVLGSFL